jgi:hypothetical protein
VVDPNSWCWHLLLAAVWRAGGFPAFGLFAALCSLAVYAAQFALFARRGASAAATGVAAVVGGRVLPGWLSPRPQIASYLLTEGGTKVGTGQSEPIQRRGA